MSLVDGRRANVVLVGSRQNVKGAVLVAPEEGGTVQTMPLASGVHLLHPAHLLEVLCMQERAFGANGVPPLPESAGKP